MTSNIVSPDFHISFTELCCSTNIREDYLVQLVDYQVIAPVSGNEPQDWIFTVSAVALVNKAARLYRDLDIDWADIALVLNLLAEIDQLNDENKQLKQQINRLLAEHS